MKLLKLARLLKPNYVEDWYHGLLSELLQRCAGGDPNVPNLQSVGEATPDYWPTVLEFIHFASAGLSPDVPPRGAGQLSVVNNHGAFSLGTLSHSVVLLDGGDLVNTRFDHSRIIFTEHPVHMEDVVFTDCVFEFPVLNAPSPYLQNAVRKLLASGMSSVTLSSG